MDIIRNEDGTLTVPIVPGRHDNDHAVPGENGDGAELATTRVLHAGEPGYIEALAEWDRDRAPDQEAATSTATGREEAMAIVHAVAVDPDHDVHKAVDSLSTR